MRYLTKKRVLSLSLVLLCLAVCASGTVAYFTAEETAHNIITSGGIDIELIELTDGGATFPTEGISGVMPGETVTKIVKVKNVQNSADAWIRVKVNKSMTAPDSTPLDDSVMTFAIDGDKWKQKIGEDWYYYHAPVAVNGETDTLFEVVKFAPEMDNEYARCTAKIAITVQAVQTANNGDSALHAAGWPEPETNN